MNGSTHLLLRLRRPLQILLLLIAAAIVAHGLFGPQLAPRNLATVLTWVHYRGLLIGALLAIGNVFCFGCPMVLARDTARRLGHPAWRWPRALRTKWLAVALVAVILFSYELFDLWAWPRATAWLVVGYFAAAVVVDVLFAGATFCKYICPVGQFNFIASTVSPTEVRVTDLATCRTCRTVDCIKGRRAATQPLRVVRRGCELGLFQPVKVGNLDCTFCLDCVAACPYDNVGLTWRVPGEELTDDSRRSVIGRLSRRPDLAALALVFTFGALVNAFAMTSPAFGVERWLQSVLHITREWPALLLLFTVILLAPLAIIGVPMVAYALVPLGAGIWLAHYGFHLLTGILTAVPVTQSAAIDFTGQALLGEPLWRWAGLQPGSVFPFQVGFIVLGMIGSLGLASRLSSSSRAFAMTLTLILGVVALWVLGQPMEMRGLAG